MVPSPVRAPALLRIRSRTQLGVTATFFVVGHQVATYKRLVAEEVRAGNDVGDHAMSSPTLAQTLRAPAQCRRIAATCAADLAAARPRPSLMHPPSRSVDTRPSGSARTAAADRSLEHRREGLAAPGPIGSSTRAQRAPSPAPIVLVRGVRGERRRADSGAATTWSDQLRQRPFTPHHAVAAVRRPTTTPPAAHTDLSSGM